MVKLNVSIMLVVCMIVGTPVLSDAKKYTSNGYEVEVNWKVKGKYLRVWGDVEKGRICKQLNVYVNLRNSKYKYSRRIDTYIRKEHSPKGRSIFSGKVSVRDNKHKKGWFVSYLDVDCSNVNPI